MTDEEHEAWKATDLAAINQAWFQHQIERMGQPMETHQVAFVAGYLKGTRAAIPAPEPKPCWSCGATLPGPSPEESRQRQEAWEDEQKGGTQ